MCTHACAYTHVHQSLLTTSIVLLLWTEGKVEVSDQDCDNLQNPWTTHMQCFRLLYPTAACQFLSTARWNCTRRYFRTVRWLCRLRHRRTVVNNLSHCYLAKFCLSRASEESDLAYRISYAHARFTQRCLLVLVPVLWTTSREIYSGGGGGGTNCKNKNSHTHTHIFSVWFSADSAPLLRRACK